MSSTIGSLRPNPAAVVSFARGEITVSLAERQSALQADAATLQLLAALCDDTGSQLALLADYYDAPSLDTAAQRLAAAGVLVADSEGDRDGDGAAAAWDDWGVAAWFLHLMTKDQRYAVPTRELFAAQAQTRPPPPPYKCMCDSPAGGHPLPRPGMLGEAQLASVLLSRRTTRGFSAQHVTRQQLADILFYTGGPVSEEYVNGLVHIVRKCSPSPGSLHPTELYCVVMRCEGLTPGIYHYCAQHHRLVTVLDGAGTQLDAFLQTALPGQPWFSEAPVIFLLTCLRDRLAWKYPSARAYRTAHLEAGHYCQTLVLAAVALGLGAFQTAAIADTAIESALGIDGVKEFVMYAAGAGHPSGGYTLAASGYRRSPHLPGAPA
jgi:SagB-type dehydrogenase family enzyme